MKSIHRGSIGGNVKLRGKLGKTLSCGCCDVWNFKSEYFKKLDELEIRNSKSDLSLDELGDNDNCAEPLTETAVDDVSPCGTNLIV